MQFPASYELRPYVKGYSVFTTDKDIINEIFYPSGYVDFAVNISNENVVTIINGRPIDMPKVEVLGQLTKPTRLTAARGTMMLIARIYPYANALFFSNSIAEFTNDSIDMDGIIGKESAEFYNRLMEADSIEEQLQEFDTFLLQRLKRNQKMQHKVLMIEQICRHISTEGALFNVKTLSDKYGFSERYIQKLFLDHVGLTPKSFFNIQRFNKSLKLVQSASLSLTSVAYDCGYYDQAHFIRDFRKFTGVTPSEVRTLYTVD